MHVRAVLADFVIELHPPSPPSLSIPRVGRRTRGVWPVVEDQKARLVRGRTAGSPTPRSAPLCHRAPRDPEVSVTRKFFEVAFPVVEAFTRRRWSTFGTSRRQSVNAFSSAEVVATIGRLVTPFFGVPYEPTTSDADREDRPHPATCPPSKRTSDERVVPAFSSKDCNARPEMNGRRATTAATAAFSLHFYVASRTESRLAAA